ncbi:hypothetical protein Glove_171g2 [Diversispora epigaea]|uniref:Uncharacterized protein n=1 Tax=Diversispora epigaea TaxID=1348612 RepID=A0A397ISS2_9GLOM|nr:hypothetical protein Glove_171g2 [Diversispora epigaea]
MKKKRTKICGNFRHLRKLAQTFASFRLIKFPDLKHLLRNVLDPKSASSTTAQLQRKRNYSDEIQRYDFPPPAKAPNWACNEQEDVVYDTEFVQTKREDEPSFASTSSSKISAEQE